MSRTDFTGPVLPDTYGALRAFREWRVCPVVPAPLAPLGSLWRLVAWSEATLRAVCRADHALAHAFGMALWAPHGGPAPDYDCVCGIYAWWHPRLDESIFHPVVTGVVDVSGTCIVGTRGVRAQVATIRALAPTSSDDMPRRKPVDWPALRPALARHYPDVTLYDSPEELWEAWPPQPPTSLIEEAEHAAA